MDKTAIERTANHASGGFRQRRKGVAANVLSALYRARVKYSFFLGIFFLSLGNVAFSAQDRQASLQQAESDFKESQVLYERAQRGYEEVLKINPADQAAHYGLAKMFFNKGLFNRAIEEYEKILEINPDDFQLIMN